MLAGYLERYAYLGMSVETDFDASSSLQRLIMVASGMGLDNLREQGSLIPMLISAKKDEYELCVIATDANDVMRMAAHRVLELPDETDSYALVFEGKINLDGTIVQAIIVQAAERGRKHGYIVFQRYEPKTYLAIGGPEYGGHAEQFLIR